MFTYVKAVQHRPIQAIASMLRCCEIFALDGAYSPVTYQISLTMSPTLVTKPSKDATVGVDRWELEARQPCCIYLDGKARETMLSIAFAV